VQALRNFADAREFLAAVYASPEYIATLDCVPDCRIAYQYMGFGTQDWEAVDSTDDANAA
ncbi:hypothetical protein, partial [Microbacterium oxydans]|uniref:hypothetical protein n=1 Tax=Microbacterium oxydans TaxID=82380 RepID=UPI0036711467